MTPVVPAGNGGRALAAAQGKPKKKPEPEIKRQMKVFAKDIRRHDEAVKKGRQTPVVPQVRAVQADQANPAYDAPETPERMIPGDETTTPVRITNVTGQPLPKADYVLSYHWETPDGREVTSVSALSSSRPRTARCLAGPRSTSSVPRQARTGPSTSNRSR